MAWSVQEPSKNLPLYPKDFNQTPEDRNWNWKSQLSPSPTRWKSNSGYFGSYCMDGMYVALHIIYNSESFKEALFKAVSWGGDSDSITAVVG